MNGQRYFGAKRNGTLETEQKNGVGQAAQCRWSCSGTDYHGILFCNDRSFCGCNGRVG
ncbi:unnamed protein product [Brugia timori]|uniref:WSC domain-containing protein n=1 Tax=Brugia timori TaxID=42155 RepID=A0A0R3QNW3_9BILA|nr:unnamed protein product [Brugia timori]